MWDPSNDTLLPATYSPAHMYGKQLCKRYLQLGLGLDVSPDRPLVACITRLVPQKGIHLIKHAIGRTAEQGTDSGLVWVVCCVSLCACCGLFMLLLPS